MLRRENSHGDWAVLLVAASRQYAALTAVNTQRPVNLVLEADTSEGAEEAGHVGPLVQTVLTQAQHIISQ